MKSEHEANPDALIQRALKMRFSHKKMKKLEKNKLHTVYNVYLHLLTYDIVYYYLPDRVYCLFRLEKEYLARKEKEVHEGKEISVSVFSLCVICVAVLHVCIVWCVCVCTIQLSV